jgi:hypothetical protein
MKKINKNEMELVVAGSGCGWVGIGLGLAVLSGNGSLIYGFSGLGHAVARCWNEAPPMQQIPTPTLTRD